MAKSRDLAALIGPALMAITASETLNFHILAAIAAPVVYLDGVVAFVAGLAVIRAHNQWSRRWPVAVTLAGWLLAVLGLYRMFAPEAQAAAPDRAKLTVTALVFLLGCFLTYKGYGPKDAERDPG
jgi:uncharacterized membrane protein